MAQKRTLYVAALNIRLHEHADADYRKFFLRLYQLKLRINYRGDDHLMISSVRQSGNYVYGTLARFVEIDPEGDWFDMTTGEKAEDQVVASINIPPSLFPNLSTFGFRFDVDRHLLVYETYSLGKRISPAVIEEFFEKLLEIQFVQDEFGGGEVNTVADKTKLEEIFTFDKLSRLSILIKRPNADFESDDFEKSVLAEMDAEGVRSLSIERHSVPRSTIEPSEETRAYAGVAANNGRVVAHGLIDEKTQTKSTLDIPLEDGEQYDPDLDSETNALDRAADRITKKYRQ